MAATPRIPQRGNIVDAKDLRYFMRIASKNWYFVAIAIVLSSVLAYLYSYKLPDVYGASTQILLKDNEIYGYQNQMYKNLGYVGAYGDIVNQKRVLTSHDLINATLEKLDFDVSYYVVGRFKRSQVHGTLPFIVSMDVLQQRLYNRPFDLKILDEKEFELSYEKEGEIVKKVYPFDELVHDPDGEYLIRVTRSPYITEQTVANYVKTDYQFIRHERNSLVNQFKNRIQVVNHDYTTILQITVEDEVAVRAKMFLDSLSKVYIDYTLKSEFDINENTLMYIDRQLDEVTVILERHEDELQDYKINKDILNLNKEENLYFQELVKFDQNRRQLELEIQSLNSLEDYVVNNNDERLLPPAIYITQDHFLKETLEELHRMQMRRNSMLYSGTDRNQGIAQLDTTFNRTRVNLLVYIKNSRNAIKDKIRDIEGQLRDYESLIRSLPKSQREILNIERRLQVNERMYLFLLEKRASTVIAKAGIVPQTKVIESSRPLGVVKPDKTKIFYTFLLGGLIVSMLLVFVRILFYDRIENADELKEMTHLPIFGEIIASDKAEENYVVVDTDPKAAITESFRTVRTNMEYIPVEAGRGKVIMVTSYRPNEGKTFCSVNLSAILAKAGKRVLLLEMDLHKPKVGKGLGLVSSTGLSNILVGRMDWREGVMNTQFENFDVILSGPTPPNASELVLSKDLERLFKEASLVYDYVLVDTPPVGLITDAILMMKFVDATLFVVNTRFANKDHITNAMDVLQQGAQKNNGFILNGVRIKKSKYYYNTNYGYGYRYAYGYGSGYGYGYGYGKRSRKDENGSAKPRKERSKQMG
jgi:capsular exopolysaccharide synthesis family protein